MFTFVLQRDHLKTEHKLESLVSRESSFLFNNLVLLAACFTVLWGTLFPGALRVRAGQQGHGGRALLQPRCGADWTVPALPDRHRPIARVAEFLLQEHSQELCAADDCGSCDRDRADGRRDSSLGRSGNVLFRGLPLAVGACDHGHRSEFLRGATVIQRHSGQNLFASMVQLTRRNTRRYGGYIVHFGIVVMFVGIAGSAFNRNVEKELGFGQSMDIGPYQLVCQSFTQDTNPNYDTEFSLLDVYRGGKKSYQLAPEKRFYQASQQTQTMVANHSTLALGSLCCL